MISDLFLRQVRLKNPPEEGSYLTGLPVVTALGKIPGLDFRQPVTFFVGENGSGKSTLLEAIATAYGFNPEGGGRNLGFSTQLTHSRLHENLLLSRGTGRARDGFFLRAESFYNMASEIDRLEVSEYYGGRSLHEQSHGESFLAVMLHRFGGQGLYILDEPEAALSPTRQLTLLSRLHQLVDAHSQFLIATHSPLLLAYPQAEIYQLEGDNITLTPYRETTPYQLTRRFLENPERYLHYIFEDE